MAKKEITSRPGLFGTVNHYDSKGHKIGESRPGFFGTTNHYDAKGHKVGSSMTGSFGNTTHWDTKGHKVGSSQSGVFSTHHYDFRGHRIGDEMVQRIITDARESGYRHLLLDTLPFLKTAIAMYKRLGFYEIPSYNNSPMEGLVYLKLEL